MAPVTAIDEMWVCTVAREPMGLKLLAKHLLGLKYEALPLPPSPSVRYPPNDHSPIRRGGARERGWRARALRGRANALPTGSRALVCIPLSRMSSRTTGSAWSRSGRACATATSLAAAWSDARTAARAGASSRTGSCAARRSAGSAAAASTSTMSSSSARGAGPRPAQSAPAPPSGRLAPAPARVRASGAVESRPEPGTERVLGLRRRGRVLGSGRVPVFGFGSGWILKPPARAPKTQGFGVWYAKVSCCTAGLGLRSP